MPFSTRTPPVCCYRETLDIDQLLLRRGIHDKTRVIVAEAENTLRVVDALAGPAPYRRQVKLS